MKRTRRFFCSLSAGALALLTLASCSLPDLSELYAESEELSSSAEEILPEPVTDSVYLAFNKLTAREQMLYQDIISQINEYEMSIRCKKVSEDEALNAYGAVLADHPEFFWLGENYQAVSYEQSDQQQTTITSASSLAAVKDPTLTEQKRAELSNVVETILIEARTLPTAYEQALYIHDYIVDHTRYDMDAYHTITEEITWGFMLTDGSTAYDCLVEGQAICTGYSAAFQLLAQELGIRCGRVRGEDLISAEGHEWNYIELDGDWYYVDTTWDDPVTDDGSDEKCHYYFCITTEELELTHRIDEDFTPPDCTATTYDYYRYHGWYLDSYSFAEAAPILRAQSGNDEIFLKFSSPQEREKAQRDLVGNAKISDAAPAFQNKKWVYYSFDNAGLVLTIWF